MSEEMPSALSNATIEATDYIDSKYTRSFFLGAYERDFTIEDYLEVGTYDIGDRYMRIVDPAWGEVYIGDRPHDAVLLELARTPLFRRLQAIEQLTLNQDYATMPNSMYFSRWQHIWGSLVFVRKMVEGRADLDDRERMVLQLRTLLSDVGHTAFSHLGDWLFQGPFGGEDLHDQDLKELLRVGGVEEILTKHGFTIAETVFPETEDWVECPSPNLCVDRVDYGIREILRWGTPTIPLNMMLDDLRSPQRLFEIDTDNQLIMRSKEAARYYAAGFSILPTEHWSHPVHRLQLQLLQSAVRSAVVAETEYESIHPREAMYQVDKDFYAHFHTWDMLHLQETMKNIATTQRRIFVTARRNDLNALYAGIQDDNWSFPEFPDPLKPYTWQSREYGSPYPPNLVIEETSGERTQQDEFTVTKQGLAVSLPALKARAIDPLIRTAPGQRARLSELEPSYGRYLAGQRKQMAKSYKATVLMRPDIAERIVSRHAESNEVWNLLIKRPRSAEALRQIVADSMGSGAGHRFDVICETNDAHILEQRRKARLLGGKALASNE